MDCWCDNRLYKWFCPIFVLYILYCNGTLGSKAANIIPINSRLDTHKLSLNLQREDEVIWSTTFPCAGTAPGFSGWEEAASPCPSSSRSLPVGVSSSFPAPGPGSQTRPAGGELLLKNTQPGPPAQFQTLILFTYIHLPRRKRKRGENSSLNPHSNTILIHIHAQCLLTCTASNGGYYLRHCV